MKTQSQPPTEAELAVSSMVRDILTETKLPLEERAKDVSKFIWIAIEQGHIKNTPLAINRVMALATIGIRQA